jgi:hypothetical protein
VDSDRTASVRGKSAMSHGSGKIINAKQTDGNFEYYQVTAGVEDKPGRSVSIY